MEEEMPKSRKTGKEDTKEIIPEPTRWNTKQTGT